MDNLTEEDLRLIQEATANVSSAIRQAEQAVSEAQGAKKFLEAHFTRKYEIKPGDTVDIATGVIARVGVKEDVGQ